MNTKLTLKLNKQVILRAKIYARKQNTSLSKMVESHLNSVTGRKSKDIEITPLVESLSGVISLANNYDYKSDYKKDLNKKYL